ncbi:MAG: hypothetical protein QXN71_02050 [Candidatus Aenigmatarchaeota archaeon]
MYSELHWERKNLVGMGARQISDKEFAGYLELKKDGLRYIFEPVYEANVHPEESKQCLIRKIERVEG